MIIKNRLKSIHLYNFKIHKSFFADFYSKFIIINGKNATGKTSLLESIAFFSQDPLKDSILNKNLINHHSGINDASIKLSFDSHEISLNISKNQKKYFVNKNKIYSIDLKNYFIAISSKTEDQYLFLSKSGKRSYFEKYLILFENNYQTIKKQYLELISIRLKNLLNNQISNIKYLEEEICNLGIQLLKYRMNFILKTNQNNKIEYIYKETALEKISNDEFLWLENAKKIFSDNRNIDGKIQKTTFSFHRFEFDIKYSNLEYNLLSNSEQKECIFSFIISVSDFFFQKLKIYPIILIDEIDSFFDNDKKNDKLEILCNHASQVFCTSPNKYNYEGAQIIDLDNYNQSS